MISSFNHAFVDEFTPVFNSPDEPSESFVELSVSGHVESFQPKPQQLHQYGGEGEQSNHQRLRRPPDVVVHLTWGNNTGSNCTQISSDLFIVEFNDTFNTKRLYKCQQTFSQVCIICSNQ